MKVSFNAAVPDARAARAIDEQKLLGLAFGALGAGMLHANWGFGEVFTALAIPAAVGAAAVLLKGARHRSPVLRVETARHQADARATSGCGSLEFRCGIVFSFGI
ncbi:hypothetical protein [Paraburkholderia sp.]|uniref:hypothetical protein n=1 Tax=Paraburkholderia sp. TaxID=1926495 RepID=UPI002392C834|nr:hypothetical protein [Paraburkholderia sp.]MDE1181088.1 hypothetical protein [Paraburkholderia sp.]